MPSIKSQVQKNAERIAQGGDLVQTSGPSNNAANPTPMPPPPPVTGLPVRGYYPQGMTLDQDFGGTSQITRTGPNMRSPTFPKQPGIVSTIISKAAAAVSSAAASLIIKVNNMLAPNQSVINFLQGTGMTITVDAAGNLLFVSTATGDGLTHGTEPPVWESDPAFLCIRDDFFGFYNNGALPTSPTIGDAGWSTLNTSGTFRHNKYYTAGNMGILQMDSGGTAVNNGCSLILGGSDTQYTTTAGFPLTAVGGWDACFVFRYPKIIGVGGTQVANSTTKLRFYLGFGSSPPAGSSNPQSTPRPANFIGLRYDTDPQSWTLSAVASSSGSTAVYTGTFTGATTNSLIGQSFVVTGFVAHASNNGTFTCTANTATNITLSNASAVAETQAANATGTVPFSDSSYHFEATQNAWQGSNLQGTSGGTANSGVSIDNNWHRFRVRSITAGTILFSLDGGTEMSLTMTTQTITAGSGSNQITFTQVIHSGGIQTMEITSNNFTTGAVCAGTSVVIAGVTGSPVSSLNGTWPAADGQSAGAVMIDISSLASNAGGNSATGTVQVYNTFSPYMMFQNDSEASNANKCVQVDFFSFVWNPNLGSAAPGTPDPTKARYW